MRKFTKLGTSYEMTVVMLVIAVIIYKIFSEAVRQTVDLINEVKIKLKEETYSRGHHACTHARMHAFTHTHTHM